MTGCWAPPWQDSGMDGTPHSNGRHLLALLFGTWLLSGCATCSLPQIDPTGQHLFVPRETRVVPGNPAFPNLVIRQPSVNLSPRQLIAPVGSEVVMLAGVCNVDNTYTTGEKFEWMISPDSVGEFTTVGEGGCLPWFNLFGKSSHKLTNTYAVGKAVTSSVHLTRGTISPVDDVTVNRGQAWIALTSPTEGTSVVTALAPAVLGWAQRKATGTIHWIDAQWVFPPAAVNPQGRNHVFTTSINRHTNGAPLAGWRVRYEILDGPAAGFAPDGREMIEVPTDELGQAPVEIVPKGLESGTARINVQIIRPAQSSGASVTPELILGSAVTTMTWTSPQLSLDTSGPSQASVGAAVTYRILLTNTGDLPAKGVVVSEEVPAGVTFVSSAPPPVVTGRKLEWDVGELPARETRSIDVTFRADQAGSFNHCASVETENNLSASDCVATSVTTPQLDVQVAVSPQAEVGQTTRFEIVVTNRSALPATGLEITSTFDQGLKHLKAESPITRGMEDLPAGASQTVYMTFQVVAVGRSCNQIEVTGAGGLRGAASACVTAVPATTPAPQPIPTQPQPVQPAGQPVIELSASAPNQARLGDVVTLAIDVFNRGNVPLTNVRIASTYDAPLRIVRAEEGFDEKRFEDELVWNLPRLEVGQSRRLRIECRCASDAVNACLRATVTSLEAEPQAKQACLRILPAAAPGAGAAVPSTIPEARPPVASNVKPAPALPEMRTPAAPAQRPADLKLTMSDLGDPIRVGSEATYRVIVRNDGELSAQGVELTITLPPELVVADTRVEDRAIPSVPIAGGIRFEKVAELHGGKTIIYTILCRSVKAGVAQVTASLTSTGQGRPVTVTEATEIKTPQELMMETR
jgi:uncharacterized repeat protein (TIGR01451 family)